MKYILIILTLFTIPFYAAAQKPNWQNLDLQTDTVFGISTEKAYKELLNGRLPTPVIVAVIDAGIDTNHEDLKAVLWRNPKVSQFSGPHGWSFIGSVKGNVHYDNLEEVRQVRQDSAKYEGKDTNGFNNKTLMSYHTYEKEKADISKREQDDQDAIRGMGGYLQIIQQVAKKIGKADPTASDFSAYIPAAPGEDVIRKYMTEQLKARSYSEIVKGFHESIDHVKDEADYQLNINYDPRYLVGDDYFNSRQRDYGSPDVMGPDATHGTHVAGIIGAVRNNGIGINGVADDVQIMAIRTVPDGDERDKDVANAIRFAADHGAKVINMSFGKALSQDKKAVDEAVKYALKKDVLLVQAAGNSNEDIDTVANFPNRNYANGGQAGAWIVVGASGWKNGSTLKAPFSNYGKTAVDVFAPGEQNYSCIPGSKYAAFDGTSMACPVVVGLACLIREYYPKLTAMQVKDIILASVVVTPFLKDRCLTSGVVNAYQALELAAKTEAI